MIMSLKSNGGFINYYLPTETIEKNQYVSIGLLFLIFFFNYLIN